MYPRLTLKQNRHKPVTNRHPWIFSGAIAKVDQVNGGDVVDVINAGGQFIARGIYNSRSQIACRIFTWKDEPINADFFRRRIQEAVQRRGPELPATCRLINSENDLLPGLIADVYSGFLVVQFLSLGMEVRKEMIVQQLNALIRPEAAGWQGIFERSDAGARAKEGLLPQTGLLAGEEPPPLLEIEENGLRFLVDVRRGHKTGFYLDQRENRKATTPLISARQNGDILNVFSYTGAFGVYAARAEPSARIANVDASEEALDLARKNFELNGVLSQGEFLAGNAFDALRLFRDQGRTFDFIILDPPKFAFSRSGLNSALRGYKDLNLLAFKLLKQNGYLVTFSCSGLVSPDLFQKVVFEASADAGRPAQILKKLGHPSDHPVLLSFPEGEYLKGLILKVVE